MKPNPARIAIITSEFNETVTGGLLWGAREVLKERGLEPAFELQAPGAFELPLLAKTLARTGKVDGVICLGCVIKGDTAHFEFISLGASIGISLASLETGVPIGFGVLTTYTDEQAEIRSAHNADNKGREAALAVLSSLEAMEKIRRL
ncbi:6,7-dimethyl-8-ribityllumazine synthase [bacterium]|jgi:6,7-dimethyl-8-ribityllumazine synthase|nr:6,7-dimethyl-8-ribityllumazine synthase [bacterium]